MYSTYLLPADRSPRIEIHILACPIPVYKWLVEQKGPSAVERMGYTIQSIVQGDMKTFPKKGDSVTIHYVGTLKDGTKFDSSRDRKAPFQTEIGVGKVIRGWDEAVMELSLGEKANLTITPDYAYGSRGFSPLIPADADLLFEVELLKIN